MDIDINQAFKYAAYAAIAAPSIYSACRYFIQPIIKSDERTRTLDIMSRMYILEHAKFKGILAF